MERTQKRFSILFTTGSLTEKSSGPYHSLIETGATLAGRGHDLTVLGTVGRSGRAMDPSWKFAKTIPFERVGPESWHFAPALGSWLETADDSFDVVCIQSIWLMLNRDVARWAYRKGLPFMITPHGNFNEVALRFSSVKKHLARSFLFGQMFRRASCYQALTEAEYRSIRAYGIEQPVCVIPHGVLIPPDRPIPDVSLRLPQKADGKKVVLYLGRLHPIKNLEGLLCAWNRLAHRYREWHLVIAGDGLESYKRSLEGLVGKLDLHESVDFVGHVDGELKAAWLSYASVFVLPSRSEGLPVAALEAMAARTAVLLSRSCNLPEVEDSGAGMLTNLDPDSIANDLDRLLGQDTLRLTIMCQRARELVQKSYSWDIVSRQMEEVFWWMKCGGVPPACVRQN